MQKSVSGYSKAFTFGLANDQLGYLIAPAEGYPQVAAAAPDNDNALFNVSPALGDHVIVHGEYIWNPEGGLIHFTHHDPQGTHEGGYIIDGGKTYN